MADEIAALLEELPGPDEEARAAVSARSSQVLRPAGALARLDELAGWLAAWQRSPSPAVRSPAVIVFVADHGVAVNDVSAYPASITAEVLRALREGAATAAVLARQVGAELHVVDAGVGRPTGDLLSEPALDEARFAECFETGRRSVAGLDADLLVLGEMGIANTTAAAALCAALLGCRAEDWTGRGTGIDDATLARKIDVVEAARGRVRAEAPPLEVLRQLGGCELVACAGALVEARRRSIPVVLDGFVVSAAVAPLQMLRHDALDHCVAGHCSSEPGHRLLLEKLGLRPLLDLDLRLGEGSGGLLAVPLIRAAAAAVTEVATFQEWASGG
ncbi:MAG: nicotinate-nucleotide--dimethylbenzimidazole phosphoribosyltransferase, partial [Actinomycetota bacterium]